jgi:hypothetical protein
MLALCFSSHGAARIAWGTDSLDLQHRGPKLRGSARQSASGLEISFTKQDITESAAACPTGTEAPSGLDKAYEILLDALGFEPPSIDAPIQRTGLSGPYPASKAALPRHRG